LIKLLAIFILSQGKLRVTKEHKEKFKQNLKNFQKT